MNDLPNETRVIAENGMVAHPLNMPCDNKYLLTLAQYMNDNVTPALADYRVCQDNGNAIEIPEAQLDALNAFKKALDELYPILTSVVGVEDSINGLFKSPSQARAAGHRYYFTGKPCAKGHIAKRFAIGGQCTVCVSTRNQDRRRYTDTPAANTRRYFRLRKQLEELCERKAIPVVVVKKGVVAGIPDKEELVGLPLPGADKLEALDNRYLELLQISRQDYMRILRKAWLKPSMDVAKTPANEQIPGLFPQCCLIYGREQFPAFNEQWKEDFGVDDQGMTKYCRAAGQYLPSKELMAYHIHRYQNEPPREGKAERFRGETELWAETQAWLDKLKAEGKPDPRKWWPENEEVAAPNEG